jgi:hypothetical protein
MPAWPHRSTWTPETIARYRAFVQLQCPALYGAGIQLDCADLCVDLLVSWAAHNGLPVILEGYSEGQYVCFDSQDRRWSSGAEFSSAVLAGIEANELVGGRGTLFGNTYMIDLSDLSAGDMLVSASQASFGHRAGAWGHMQMVVSSSLRGPRTGAPTSGRAVIFQGNLRAEYFIFHYVASAIQRGEYFFDAGRLMFRREGAAARDFGSDWTRLTVSPCRWNFAQFNEGPTAPCDPSLH